MAIVSVVVLLATCSGCSAAVSPPTIDAPPPPPAPVRQTWPGCLALGAFDDVAGDKAPDGAGSIPDDFAPTAAIVCELTEPDDPDAGSVWTARERRADTIGDLVEYRNLPSRISTVPDQLVCPAMAVSPSWLFLTDADGRWIYPQLPTDPCGFPLGLFDDTPQPYDRIRFTDTVICTVDMAEQPRRCR